MTKSELIDKLVKRTPGLSIKDATLVVNTIFKAMSDSLTRGERIEIRGFGSFSIRERDAREGRNPKTGELVHVSEKQVVYFKPGKEVLERLNEE